jgi:hypothetical protein
MTKRIGQEENREHRTMERHHAQREADEKHQGHNLKRFREMLGIKQEHLAIQLGPGWSQKKISLLEGKEVLDEGQLVEVAALLKTTPEIIRFFSERVARACVMELHRGQTKAPEIVDALEAAGAPGPALLDSSAQAIMDHCVRLVQEQKQLYEELLVCERKYVAVLEKLAGAAEPM